MTTIEQTLPTLSTVHPDELVEELRKARSNFEPFDSRVEAFIGDLSRFLRRDHRCRSIPAVAALAYWIRPANHARLKRDWLDAGVDHLVRVPRGVVFHLPPANVDTLFVYSWLMSALCGNANAIRLSSRSDQGDTVALLDAIRTVLADHPEVAATTTFVRYAHDAQITEQLSAADVRVVWGGDETVRQIRSVPMNPLATELTFADRFSMSVIDASALLGLSSTRFDELVRQFYNDSYWFDQLGCSSPRAVFWRGGRQVAAEAQARFVDGLSARLEHENYVAPTGAVMNKLTRAAVLAASHDADHVNWADPRSTIVHLGSTATLDREHPGAGMFLFLQIDDLSEIADFVERRDQTLSYFGVESVELQELTRTINGRGLDRIVPVGEALQFDRIWDGWDLLVAFTRIVNIRPSDRQDRATKS